MVYELTKDGLFNYFGPDIVEGIIEFPLVKRHLSALDYCQCKEVLSDPRRRAECKRKKSPESVHAILSFTELKHAAIDEIAQYLSVAKIKEAYSHCYGEYFELFQEKFAACVANPPQSRNVPLSLLDPISEKKLILLIKAALALPLQAFTNALIEQNTYLEQIESQLTFEAGKAQSFIATIQEDDANYKQTVISLAFSIVRMGLNVVHVGDLLNVSESIATLAASAFDKVENRLSNLVLDVQLLVMNTHFNVLQQAERELLAATKLEDIRHQWQMYRTQVLLNSKKAIDHVLEGCVNNDDFIRCVIKETMRQYEGLSEDELLISASDNACLYVKQIVTGLTSQVNKIRHIRDAVLSAQGSNSIEFYFRRICLINYTMQHEHSQTMIQSWLTKKLGHLLSFYFPDVVFQKKWSSEKWLNFIHHGIEYGKQKLTLEQYQERRRNAAVILGLFRNSSKVRQELFASLEEQIPQLSDRLVEELQKNPAASDADDVFLEDTVDTVKVKKARYCFKKRRLSLFSFSEPNPEEVSSKPIKKTEQSAVLLSHHELLAKL